NVLININSYYFIRREKTVFDALLQGIGVNRLAEVSNAGDVFGFLGCGSQANLDRAGKVVENLTPGGIFSRAAAVAFINDHHVEELGRDAFENLVFFIRTGDGLIQTQIDFVGWINLAVLDLGHDRAEGLEIIDQSLINEDIPISQKEDAFDLSRLQQTPD